MVNWFVIEIDFIKYLISNENIQSKLGANILKASSKHVLNVDKVKNSDLKVNQLKTGLGIRAILKYSKCLY